MKKITLLFVFALIGFSGFSQESSESKQINSESLERETEYIIVLDDVVVDDNINMLLNDRVIEDEIHFNFNNHELVHDEPNSSDIESKFIDGAFTYNEYAYNYKIEDTIGNKSS
jgi:hypothetical protein